MHSTRDSRFRSPAFAILLLVTGAASASAQLVADFTATPTSGTQALTVAFTNLSPTGPSIQHLWQFGDGDSSSVVHPVHAYDEPGSYTVSLFVQDTSTLQSDIESKPGFVTVDPGALVAEFSVDVGAGQYPLDVQFTDESAGVSLTDWLWDFGDGAGSTLQHPAHTYQYVAFPTDYTVTFTASVGQLEETVVKSALIHVVPRALGPAQVLSTALDGAISVFAADLDQDGDQDILTASRFDDTIAWFENIDGRGSFGPRQVISAGADDARSVHAADLDGDGDADVLSASHGDGRIAWYRNTDGLGTFALQPDLAADTVGAVDVFAVDLDGDGDADVVAALASDHGVVWWENTDGLGTFGPQRSVAQQPFGAKDVHAADLDGDGDEDVLYVRTMSIAWCENLDGLGTFAPAVDLPGIHSFPAEVRTADLDEDGDADVLIAEDGSDKIVWHENLDGAGTFGGPQVVTDLANGASSVTASDIDGDGDPDVLSASRLDDSVDWYENLGGAATFGPRISISSEANGAESVHTADLDGDGDLDVLAASVSDDTVAWYENTLVTSPWVFVGGGSPGLDGRPVLRPSVGALLPGSLLTLEVDRVPPDSLLLAWLAFSSAPLDVLGGTLHAFPQTAQFLRVSSSDGDWSQSLNWPVGLPTGVDFWLQFLVQDVSVPAGITLSNGLKATLP